MENPEIIIVPALFIMIGFIVWVTITGWQRRQRLKLVTDFNSRLLDKLGSVKDFSEFLQTEAGVQFMDSLATDTPAHAPHERILRATQLGVVLLALGGGLLLLASHFSMRREYDAYLAFGVIAISLGVGFAVSSGISYKLTAALGLMNRSNNRVPRN
jgi:hypothetical protein